MRSPTLTVLASCLGFGCSTSPAPAVILTTDVGTETDDQWAVAYLALLADAGVIDLLGIVTTHAPNVERPPAETAARVARKVLETLNLGNPPRVVAGSNVPLEDAETPLSGAGGKFIVETARSFSPANRLTVLSIGAATDLGDALLTDSEIADNIRVVAMGFEGWPRGGDPFNVKNDPRAYEVILASRAPLTVGAADVCVRHLTEDRESVARHTQGGGPAGDALRASFESWIARKEALCRKYTGRKAWPLWDLITVACLLGMATDEEHPRPRLREDLTFDHGPFGPEEGQGVIRWITKVDEERLWADFEGRLKKHSAFSKPDS